MNLRFTDDGLSAHAPGVPRLNADLYSDAALTDSTELFAQIRDAGPVVWLPRHRMYAMGRFDDVRAALRDDQTLLSGGGVAANPVANRLGRDTTLSSDHESHMRRRRVLMRSLGAKAIAGIEDRLEQEARTTVGRLGNGAWFDAAPDFASPLPVKVVSDLVGVSGGSEQMLRWAAATFDGLGPINRRAVRQMRHSLGLLWFTRRLRPSAVAAGSWAASVFQAAAEGELTNQEARALVVDFIAPALDTTILASTHLLRVLSEHPDAWQQVREDPSLIPAAVVENVRLASPIRGFTRTIAADTQVGGVDLRAGDRVALLFGAANLDETRFPDPGRFDLHRPGNAHVGWGNGPHTCVGIHLAKLEMKTLLGQMAPVVARIETGPPTRLRNNTLQGISAMRARFVTAPST